VDDFKTDELVATGQVTPAGLAALLEARGITYHAKTQATGGEASGSLSRWWRS
jgi:hypothetical protein